MTKTLSFPSRVHPRAEALRPRAAAGKVFSMFMAPSREIELVPSDPYKFECNLRYGNVQVSIMNTL